VGLSVDTAVDVSKEAADIVLLEKDFNPISAVGTVPIGSMEEEKPFTPLQKVEVPQELPLPRQEQTPRTKQCPKCYAQNDPKYKYCHKCGAKLSSGP